MKKKAARSNTTTELRARLVKVQLTDEESRKLRVAAALHDMAVSEFVRMAAIERATSAIDKGFPRT